MVNPLNHRGTRTSLSVILTFCSIMAMSPAHGQALDSVEVISRNNTTEIIVHFALRLQYLRHAPVDYGKSVRIYLQVVGIGLQPEDLMPATKILQKTDRSPRMTITFPEIDNSLLVNFDEPVRYAIRPGPDGRSILILLPTAAKE